MTNAGFHLAGEVPPLESTGLAEVADVVPTPVKVGRRKPDLGEAMSPAEISRRALEFCELRDAGQLRHRA